MTDTLPLSGRIRRHIAQMAPHQKERATGRLLIEAAARIESLEMALGDHGETVIDKPTTDSACKTKT